MSLRLAEDRADMRHAEIAHAKSLELVLSSSTQAEIDKSV